MAKEPIIPQKSWSYRISPTSPPYIIKRKKQNTGKCMYGGDPLYSVIYAAILSGICMLSIHEFDLAPPNSPSTACKNFATL